MHRFLLHNDTITATEDHLLSPGQVGFLNGWGVFSTIRVCHGVLFAFDRHYRRMKHDAELMRVPFDLTSDHLEQSLQRLVAANQALDATLRVAMIRNKGGLFEAPQIQRAADLIAFTADLTEWGNGVKLTYIPQGRHAASVFAGTKVTSWAQNLTWYEEAHENGFDEVLLLNEHGHVSECTSANVFIVERDHVWTPPLRSAGCLPGITRALLLEEIRLPGLTFGERDIRPSELEASDQVFITSTTRDLLPVTEVGHVQLHQSPEVLARLQQAFVDYRDHYVAHHANAGSHAAAERAVLAP